MKTFRLFFLFFVIASVNTSCGFLLWPEVEDNPESSKPINFQRYSNSFEVRCTEDTCPEAVGVLLASVSPGISSCTAFLISKDTILTNSHCIPSELKQNNVSCNKKIKIIFPPNHGHSLERYDCAEIIFSSFVLETMDGKTDLRKDYAIVKLSTESSRTPIPISNKGFDKINYMIAWVANINIDNRVASIGKVICPMHSEKMATYFDIAHTIDYSYVDCPIVKGNSGSPLLNSNGEAVGIIFASNPYFRYGLATNLACIDEITTNSYSKNPNCR